MAESIIGRSSGSLKYTNKAVNTWANDPESTNAAFPKRGSITGLTGVTSSMFAQVAFNIDDALSGNFAPITKCGTNVVYIYAAAEPSSSFRIPSIVVLL